MFDRTDVLWREEPTPDPAHKPARDDAPTVDQARQVNRRPGAPGQHPRSTDPDPDDRHTFDGEDRPRADTPEDRERDRQAREQHRGWQAREAREGRPRVQRPSEERAAAYSHRHDSDRGRSPLRGTRPRAATLPALDRRATRDMDKDRGWTDQDRAGIRRFTKDPPTPREPKQDRAKPDARTDGHRREYNAREAQPRDRRSRTDRDAIADVGMYRAVSYKDLSEQHYDNHPYVTRRAVTRMVRAGLIEEHEATGPQGNTFKVLHAAETPRTARRWTPATSPSSRHGPASSSRPSCRTTRPCTAPRWTSGRASRPRAGAWFASALTPN